MDVVSAYTHGMGGYSSRSIRFNALPFALRHANHHVVIQHIHRADAALILIGAGAARAGNSIFSARISGVAGIAAAVTAGITCVISTGCIVSIHVIFIIQVFAFGSGRATGGCWVKGCTVCLPRDWH